MVSPNKGNIQLWVDALESGSYQQTIGYLKYEDGFCCLGVACDVYAKSLGQTWDEIFEDMYLEIGHLPDEVAEWLGLSDDATVHLGNPPQPAAHWNDSIIDRKTFSEIAGMIKERYLNND